MKFRDLRYLAAYLVPVFCFAGLCLGGWAAPGTIYLGFMLVPVIELFVPATPRNDTEEVMQAKSRLDFYDNLLYLNVPALYFIVGYYVWLLGLGEMTTFETVSSIFNVGVFLGVCGINVAHELGHRENPFDRWMARLLLIPVLYSHFTLEHNYGHHLKVATPEDPATARKNEPVYLFYYRSIVQGYQNAWKIGNVMREAAHRPKWMNEVLIGHIAQFIFLAFIIALAGFGSMLVYAGAALVGILALETVNYIEHYGLLRKRMESGRYEPMTGSHSWNSNHELGRILLFELVRHADHHHQSTRKYQTLRHLDQSPQLPFGYPMSMLLALVPPVWFRIMNPRVDKLQRE